MLARFNSIPVAFSSALQGSVHGAACPLRSFPPSLSLSPCPCGVCRCAPAHMEVTERYQVSCSVALHKFWSSPIFLVRLASQQTPKTLLLPLLAALTLWESEAIVCSYLMAGDPNSGSRA